MHFFDIDLKISLCYFPHAPLFDNDLKICMCLVPHAPLFDIEFTN
jgi:hypothetical protein